MENLRKKSRRLTIRALKPVKELFTEAFRQGCSSAAISAAYGVDQFVVLEILRRSGEKVDKVHYREVGRLNHPSITLAFEAYFRYQQTKNMALVCRECMLEPTLLKRMLERAELAKSMSNEQIRKDDPTEHDIGDPEIEEIADDAARRFADGRSRNRLAAVEAAIETKRRARATRGAIKDPGMASRFEAWTGSRVRRPSMNREKVYEACLAHLGIPNKAILSRQQNPKVRDARQLIAVLLYRHCCVVMAEIGRMMQRRSSGAGRFLVNEGLKRIQDDPDFAEQVKAVERSLGFVED